MNSRRKGGGGETHPNPMRWEKQERKVVSTLQQSKENRRQADRINALVKQ